MAHESIGLGAIPRRESIRAKARVHHRQMACVIWVFEIGIERKQLIWGKHTFVDDDIGRQRADVKKMALGQVFITA